jgi:hypothetical protein
MRNTGTRTRASRRIRVEQLEDRTVPTVDWVGSNADWRADVNNWLDTSDNSHHFPGAADDVRINTGVTVTHSTNSETVHSIAVSNASSLVLSGGTITDGDLSVTADSSFKLQGGTLAGANVLTGTTITGTNFGGYLSGVTIGGTFDLATVYGAYSYVNGGLNLNNGTINIGNIGPTTYGYLYFYYAGSQTLGGTGTINFGDSTSNSIYSYTSFATDVLTIAPGVTINASNGQFACTTRLDLQGTITVDPVAVGSALTSTTFTITANNWVNNGTIQALHGGGLNLTGTSSATSPAWTNTAGHTISIQDNGILALNGSGTPTTAENSTWINAGTISATVVATGNPATNLVPTVNLGGTFATPALGTFNHPTNSDGNSAVINITGTLYNVGSTFTLNATTGSWYLRGGTIQGGSIAATSGFALIDTNYSGYLSGVTIDGTAGNVSPFDMSSVYGANAYVNGGLTLNNATLNIGSVGGAGTYGYLYFYYAGSQTIGGTGTINFGDSTSNSIYTYTSIATDTLTVAAGVSIKAANGQITGNTIIDFQNSITVDPIAVGSTLTSTTFTINSNNWFNNGTMQALHGGSLTLIGTGTATAPAWTNSPGHTISIQDNGILTLAGAGTPTTAENSTWKNDGTIIATVVATGNPATNLVPSVFLGGTFTIPALGTFNHPTNADGKSASVNISGTLYNVGSALTLNATTGSWYLRGGTIQGGSIASTSGYALLGTIYGGYLSAVTLDGTGGNAIPFDMTSIYGGYTYVNGGLKLNNATLNLGSVGASPNYNYLYFYYAGPQTIGGTGTINFGDSGSNAIYLYDYVQTSKFTVEPGITIQGSTGSISSNATIDFQGTVTADPTTVGSSFTNTTITINAFSWSNEGTVQALNTGRVSGQGTISNYSAGTLTGGTWKAAGNGILRLFGANIAVNAASIVLDGPNANFYSDGGTTDALGTFAANAAAGSFTIRNGKNFVSNGTFSNAGVVNVETGSQLSIGSQYAATVIAFSSQYSTGSWSAEQTLGPSNTPGYGDYGTSWAASNQNGTSEFLTLGFATPDYADGVVIRETLGNGFVTQVDAIDTADVVHTVWTGTDPSLPGTAVNLLASWPLTPYLVKAVKIYVDTNHSSTWEEIDSVQLVGPLRGYVQTGGTTTVDGNLTSPGLVDVQGGLLQGDGTIDGDVKNASHVSPGVNGPGSLTVTGDYTQTAAGTLDADIGGLSAGTQYDRLTVNGDISLNGALNVAFVGAYLPVVDDQFLIFDNAGSNPISGNLGVGEGTTFLVAGGNRKFHITYQGIDLGGTGNDIVLSTSNIAPTLDAIPDPAPILENSGLQTINLSGISAGGTESQFLTVTATSSKPSLVPNPTVNYTSPNTFGSISYTPNPNLSGATFITVTVTDNAGTAHGGVNTFSRTFRVEVGFVNHPPTFTKGGDQQVLEDAGSQTVNAWASNMSPGPPEDAGQSLTFLVSTDNDALFSVLPAIDATTGTLTYTPAANANGSATVTVRLKDDGGTANDGIDTSAPQTFTIAVTAVNDAPSFTQGNNPTIAEDDGPRTIAGWATSISAGPVNESGQGLTFQLTTNNDALFSALPAIDPITGNLTYTSAANANGNATVTVKLIDNGGTANGGEDTFTDTFTIAVTSVNDRPVLDANGTPMLPYTPTLGKVLPAGGLVSDLTRFVTDIDAGAVKGIAVVAVDTAKGQWWYNLTGGTAEANWTVIPAVSESNALLLADDGNTRVRFVPAKGFTGFASLTFKAWDQSKAPLVEGNMDDTTNVADTSYSTESDRGWIAVGKTKPTVDPDGRTVMKPVLPVYKPNARVLPLAAVMVKDIIGIAALEAPSVPAVGLGIGITSADNSDGHWEFQLAKTKIWLPVNPVTPTSVLLLRPTDKLRFVPTLTSNGPAPLTFLSWDQSPGSGTAGTLFNPAAALAAFGSHPITAVLDLTPIMDLSVPAVLNPINAGQTTNDGLIFADMMSVSRVVGGNLGVAIIGTKGTGTWEYRPAGSASWLPVGKVSTGQALFLNPDTEIRFTAMPTALPQTATLSFKAWDKTKFAVGSRGGATGSIVSKQTEILTVAVGNTAPTLTPSGGVTLPSVSSSSTKLSAGTQIGKLLAGVAITDTPKALKGIAIVGVDNSNGKWQYSVSPNVWIDVNFAGLTSAVLLADTSKIRFVPNAGFTGTASFSFTAWDRTAGQAGDRINTLSGLNSFSVDSEVATITVTS